MSGGAELQALVPQLPSPVTPITMVSSTLPIGLINSNLG